MALELWLAAVILATLIAYALSGGADFGGGVWDVLARGPRAADQRSLIAHAIAPIWEANHVWLIVLIVLLWVGFPLVYSSVSTALHIPLLVMLLGIVLRGSSFVFRAYGGGSERELRNWGWLFSITSIITPVMLGLTLGATATGAIEVSPATGEVRTDFVSEWLAPFPFVTGLFILALFTFLAAVYLTAETNDRELEEAFRRRALISGLTLALLAAATLALSIDGAPPLWAGMFGRWWSIPIHLITIASGVATLITLWWRRFQLARILVVAHVTFVILDWGLATFPWILPGSLTIHQAAAPEPVLEAILIVLAIGGAILAPSLLYLYRVFKIAPTNEPPPTEDAKS